MFRQVLIWLLVFIIIAALILWVIGGGPRSAVENISSISFVPKAKDEAGFKLPWQPAELFPTIDISDALLVGDDSPASLAAAQAELLTLQDEYDRLTKETASVRMFGTPSPYAGHITLTDRIGAVRATETHAEILELSADYQNTAPVSLAGWSLESALSGTRVYIPQAASVFLMGAANTLGPVSLEPGTIALLTSGPSPVGVSFRENTCSGYLNQFQTFEPPIYELCPSPSSVLPLTEENLMRYGDGCFDVLNTIPVCRFPSDLPHTAWPSCRTHLSNVLSYNGCVSSERTQASFSGKTWRLFLGAQSELWRNTHDAIRLLDAEGKTVDVFVY